MFRFLDSLFASDPSSGRTEGHTPKTRLGLETMEDRLTPGGGNASDGSWMSTPGGGSSTSSTPPPTTTPVYTSDPSPDSYTWQDRIWAG